MVVGGDTTSACCCRHHNKTALIFTLVCWRWRDCSVPVLGQGRPASSSSSGCSSCCSSCSSPKWLWRIFSGTYLLSETLSQTSTHPLPPSVVMGTLGDASVQEVQGSSPLPALLSLAAPCGHAPSAISSALMSSSRAGQEVQCGWVCVGRGGGGQEMVNIQMKSFHLPAEPHLRSPRRFLSDAKSFQLQLHIKATAIMANLAQTCMLLDRYHTCVCVCVRYAGEFSDCQISNQ